MLCYKLLLYKTIIYNVLISMVKVSFILKRSRQAGDKHRVRGLQTGLLCLVCLLATQAWADLQLSVSSRTATAGNYQLSWQSDTPAPQFELQESHVEDFSDSHTLYQGNDTSSAISGRANGHYYYRVRLLDSQSAPLSDWSQPIAVTVEHHSLSRAFAFFFLGLLVFVITVVTILRGNRRHHSH